MDLESYLAQTKALYLVGLRELEDVERQRDALAARHTALQIQLDALARMLHTFDVKIEDGDSEPIPLADDALDPANASAASVDVSLGVVVRTINTNVDVPPVQSTMNQLVALLRREGKPTSLGTIGHLALKHGVITNTGPAGPNGIVAALLRKSPDVQYTDDGLWTYVERG